MHILRSLQTACPREVTKACAWHSPRKAVQRCPGVEPAELCPAGSGFCTCQWLSSGDSSRRSGSQQLDSQLWSRRFLL
eukprot:2879168-Amphidinium_carterae.1